MHRLQNSSPVMKVMGENRFSLQQGDALCIYREREGGEKERVGLDDFVAGDRSFSLTFM